MYTRACIEHLAIHLTYLGKLVAPSTQWPHPVRGPLSFHMPLSRHAACFLSLSVVTHKAPLRQLMAPFLSANPTVLRRLMEELANVLVCVNMFSYLTTLNQINKLLLMFKIGQTTTKWPIPAKVLHVQMSLKQLHMHPFVKEKFQWNVLFNILTKIRLSITKVKIKTSVAHM